MKQKGYLICPVRNVTPKFKSVIDKFLTNSDYHNSYDIHSFVDVNQDDSSGYFIVQSHSEAIKKADRVFIIWDSKSQGSIFDLGMAIALRKPLTFIFAKPTKKELKSKSYYKVARLIEAFGYDRNIVPDYPDWSII